MKEIGATIYLTWDEYSAIHESIDNISTQCHAADEEYVNSVEPTLTNLNSIVDKFKNSHSRSVYRKALSDNLLKHGMSTKEVREALKQLKNTKL